MTWPDATPPRLRWLQAAEMDLLRALHPLAQREGFGLHCARCGQDVRGTNRGDESRFRLRCACTEWVGLRSDLSVRRA
jgi:hypothetical protein